jgi:hypothetical protein
VIDRSLCQVKRVRHARHFDPTTNTRGLVYQPGFSKDPAHLQLAGRQAVTMTTAPTERSRREGDPLLNSEPSPLHASPQFVRVLGIKRDAHDIARERKFLPGKLCGDFIPEAYVDHPKHGTPFAHQQRTRTRLQRYIGKMQKEVQAYQRRQDVWGMTAREQLPKAAAEQALGELQRVLQNTTGAKAAALEQRMREVKGRMKKKLQMMGALKSKGFGDFSFMAKMQAYVQATTGEPVRLRTKEEALQEV